MQPTPLSRRSFLVSATIATAGVILKPAFGESQELAGLTLKEASELLRSKTASPVDLTQACLKPFETYNPALNAFITVLKDQAMETCLSPKFLPVTESIVYSDVANG
jgi:aspartyl-tRNA(Asn)/glutamyl-tRNA(Gln) amidotransferase subunit A